MLVMGRTGPSLPIIVDSALAESEDVEVLVGELTQIGQPAPARRPEVWRGVEQEWSRPVTGLAVLCEGRDCTRVLQPPRAGV